MNIKGADVFFYVAVVRCELVIKQILPHLADIGSGMSERGKISLIGRHVPCHVWSVYLLLVQIIWDFHCETMDFLKKFVMKLCTDI